MKKKYRKNYIPRPEEIYALAIIATAATVLVISNNLNQAEKESTQNKIVQQSKEKKVEENIQVISPTTEEPINLMPYFEEEKDALYREHAEVIYHNKLFHLKDIYTLTNEENSYLCYLDREDYYYCDMDTDSAIAINGYEDWFNYRVEDVQNWIDNDDTM